MSKLRALAEKEIAELHVLKETLIKAIEQTKQALVNREQSLAETNKNIEELETFLNGKKLTVKGKK